MGQITKSKNISIKKELLNKYSNISQLLEDESCFNNYDEEIIIKDNLKEIENVKYNLLTSTEAYHLALKIFQKYNNFNKFNNNGYEIIVSNGDIKESVNKIYYNKKQRNLLKEHLLIFSNLGNVIERAILVCQTTERKNRENNAVWSYYLIGLKINKKKYIFEFDVVSRDNNENHYRVQRLKEIKKQTSQLETL